MNSNLQLVKSSYVGLNDAKEMVSKTLRQMTRHTPVQYNMHKSDVETVITFIGNGMVTTVHTQPLGKGGVR